MPTAVKASQPAIFVVSFLIAAVLLYNFWSTWPWSTIGIALAFAGVLVMLLRDTIRDYGDDYDSEANANLKGKPLARRVHPYAY